jgi:hypothetical protein
MRHVYQADARGSPKPEPRSRSFPETRQVTSKQQLLQQPRETWDYSPVERTKNIVHVLFCVKRLHWGPFPKRLSFVDFLGLVRQVGSAMATHPRDLHRPVLAGVGAGERIFPHGSTVDFEVGILSVAALYALSTACLFCSSIGSRGLTSSVMINPGCWG